VSSTDEFISLLYRATKRVSIEHYRQWALNELKEFLEIDAAVWSTGHLSTRTFHTHTCLNLPTEFPDQLIENIAINPISAKLFSNAGKAVDMKEVIEDNAFYRSDIYHTVFEPNKIQRILSSIHIDSRSGIYTLLSVYRFNRSKPFTEKEKGQHQRILFHLIEAASHACMLSLKDELMRDEYFYAICDQHGIYHEAESEFLDIIETTLSPGERQLFPLELPLQDGHQVSGNYLFSSENLGELFRLRVRLKNKLDSLTAREMEVVEGVTKGLSFKIIAKQLKLSPSTVSNHLYRIYHKLNINSRAELAELITEQNTNQ
jgi:DNA-binding CsgD family transcriptional regulator